MPYILPSVLVFQDFSVAPSAATNPLRALIVGPNAQLVRYAEDDERDLGLLGSYDWLDDAVYAWPHRTAGAVVDQAYTKLWVKDALLHYFDDSVGGAATMTVTRTGGRNTVGSDAVNFQTNGAYARDAQLLDRDVQIGDVAKVRFLPVGDDPVTLWTYVNGIIGDTVAAVVATPARDADNAANHSASAAVVQVHGPWNAITATASASAYDPYPTGQVSETYTVVVTASSSNNDFTTATLRVISASGLDDVDDVTPSAEGVATALGTHGATITFDDAGGADASASAADQDVSPNDLIAGQRFEVTVHALFTATPAPTANSTYTGSTDTTYVVEVVEGHKFASSAPKVQVTTTTGVDISGPTAVTAAATPVAIGTKGLTLTFAGLGLALGDRFTVAVTAAAEGPMRNLLLGHTIDPDLDDGTPCDVTLFIRKPLLEVAQNRTGFAPLVNFETSATQITVKSGIQAYDETWTDGGEQVALPVESDSGQGYGKLYVEYRAWLATLCNEVNAVADVGSLGDLPGALHPDNPLKWGVFKALENSNGVEVKYAAVCNPADDDSWVAVLDRLIGRDDVYGLVPLTTRRTVQDLFVAHADDESAPEQGLWRVAWLALEGLAERPVVSAGSDVAGFTAATTSDGEMCLATIQDDGESAGTQYTIVHVPAGNAKFIANGVRPGDVVRALYTGDGFGNFTYSEFVVDDVQTEDQLRLLSGPAAAINTAAKIEVWRNLTATEESAEIAVRAGTYANRRVRAVWPDSIETSGTNQAGYFLCAALAGLRSGVLPHQPLTRVEIQGFTDVSRTTAKFNKTQLDAMAAGGVWIVTQELSPAAGVGKVYTRHAVTTGSTDDVNQREEMLTSNIDSISFRFKDTYSPYIGVTNVTPSNIDLIRLDTLALIEVLKTEKFTANLGGQLIDATIVALRAHATLKDRLVATIDVTPPYPLDNIELHLVV